MGKTTLRAVLILSVILLACCPVFSQPIQNLSLPQNVGVVKETYTGEKQSTPFIVQIQDAHCNYEAQKNLARILEYLVKQDGLKLIMVEGGSGDVSLSFLRKFSDKKTREAVAEKYLKLGEISGEEYLDIVSDYDIQLFGIEDQELYDSNLNAFLELQNCRDQGLADLQQLRQVVSALEPGMYTPAMQEFRAKKGDYENKKITLAEYCTYLKNKANVQSEEEFPNLVPFCQTSETEKGLDFKEAEAQRNQFIKDLAQKLQDREVKALVEKTRQFKEGGIEPRDYYRFLEALAERKSFPLKQSYPQLSSYITYIKSSRQVNAQELLKEIQLLEDLVKKDMLVSEDDRQLDEISTSIDLFEKFLKLDMTPEEYALFKARGEANKTSRWIGFLADNCRTYGVNLQPSASPSIDDNFSKLENFYALGVEREKAFMTNINDRISKDQPQVAVIITGGFHTTGLSRLLKQNGYSYAIVTPAVTQTADPEIYFSVLRGEKAETDDYEAADTD
ncbi:MAG: hypothetical protein ACM3OC_03880 [Deltaproteobacteria bacterium]